MKWLSKILYPEDCRVKSNSVGVSHPLHREDPLYDAHDAQEQVRILAERTAQQKALKNASNLPPTTTNLRSPKAISSRDVCAAGAHNLQTLQSRVAQSHSHLNVGQRSRRSSVYSPNQIMPNGSSSSRYGSTIVSQVASAGVLCTLPRFSFIILVLTINSKIYFALATLSPTKMVVNTPGTACSSGTAASESTASPVHTPPAARCGGTPGTASSANTAASVLTVNPVYTPVGDVIVRVKTPGTASSSVTAFSVSLPSPLSSRSSTPTLLQFVNINNAITEPVLGKRTLDFDEQAKISPLLQKSRKRRVTAVTVVLPYLSTPLTPSSSQTPLDDKWDDFKNQDNNSSSRCSNKLSVRSKIGSPESLQSESTENLFVSASDRDSGCSSV